MADNPGAYPLDPTTEVGKLRVTIGDVNSTPYNPVRPNVQNYKMFSDVELEVFIAQGSSVLRAAGFAYLALAAQASLNSKSVADYDLRVDTTKRGADLRAIAQRFFDQADEQDAGTDEGFQIVPTGLPLGGGVCEPELAQRIYRKWC